MQLKVVFKSDNPIVLPVHYNHIVQGFIYKIIDEKLADFLHNNGFGDKRKFKMFTFSRLLGKFDIKSKPKFIIFEDSVTLMVSSPYGKFCQSFGNGIFKKKIFLGRNQLEVIEAELMPSIVIKDEIIVETLSPIVVYSTFIRPDGLKYTAYFQPKEKDFERLIYENLIKKYQAFNGSINYPEAKIEIEPLDQPKQNLIEYKGFIIKGYSGRFKINGPVELLQIGIDSGLGSKNSMGFGMIKIV